MDKTHFSDIYDFIDRTWIGGSFLCIYPWSTQFLEAMRDGMGVPICAVHSDREWIQSAKRAGCDVWIYNYTMQGRSLAALDTIVAEHAVTSAIVYGEAHGDNFGPMIERLFELDVRELYVVTHRPATYLAKLDCRYSVTNFEGGRIWHLMRSNAIHKGKPI